MTHENPDDDAANPELASLPAEMPPPPAVRAALVGQLRHAGLIRRRRPRRSVLLQAAAMLAVGFAAGWLASRGLQPAGPGPHGTRYMLLLYGAAAPGDDRRVEEYRAWAAGVARRGIRVSGEKLGEGSTALGDSRGVPPGPELNGYFTIEVGTEAEALAIAGSHPHVRHGGTIVIRRIDPT